MPAVNPVGSTSTRIAGTLGALASLIALRGNTESQDPPETVETVALNCIWPTPEFSTLKLCGGGGPPPTTAKKVKPVCGMTTVCETAETLIVTGTLMLCAGLALTKVTVPE